MAYSSLQASEIIRWSYDSTNQAVKTTLQASTAAIGTVSGRLKVVSTSFTRPANVTAYVTKTVMADSTSAATIMTFSNCALANGAGGMVLKARAVTTSTGMVGSHRLWLYNQTITMINDAAAFPLLNANFLKRVGYIDFTFAATEGTGSDCIESQVTDARLMFKCAAADTSLYGIWEVITAFTPVSGASVQVELTIDQNNDA